MLLSGPFEIFVEASPVSVMMRGIIENQFHPKRLQRIFEETQSHSTPEHFRSPQSPK